jgi:two-component system response regulator NreC
MEVAGEAADGGEALSMARSGEPDIVILAISMPGPGRVHAIEELRRAAPGAQVIVLTTNEDRAHVQAALQAGAMGYVARTADPAELVSAIHAVRAGRIFFDSSLSAETPAAPPTNAPESRRTDFDLSARELQVLRLLAQGHSNQEIATHIDLSVKTIETYRHRISVKLGLNSRAEMYQVALKHGLLAPDTEQA